MSDHGYRSNTAGEKWGCAAAMLVGVPILIGLVLFHALGDCVDGEHCDHGIGLDVFVPALCIALPVGLAVRWIVNLVATYRD